MKKIAIIGAGVSGMSAAHFLKDKYDVTVFEKEDRPGGLIKCRRVEGSLFHTCGGHVFNSKRKDVLEWFWSRFNQESEFTKADRNSVVFLDRGLKIPYPIENHIYLLDNTMQNSIINDFLEIYKNKGIEPHNFEEFLKCRFGNSLYNLYFRPYNEKVWRRDLKSVPLSWLEGKLPMPSVEEMIFNNINHVQEKSFVHSTFWYENENGSQFLANRLAEGINIRYNTPVNRMEYTRGKWNINGEVFDSVVYCGNIKEMAHSMIGVDIASYTELIANLEYHGTTSVFCEIDANPYSWIYLPSREHESHRIICTGNFARSNNEKSLPTNRITATIEFTDQIDKEQILNNLSRIPLHPKFLDSHYNQYTYPIQDSNTRAIIRQLKNDLSSLGFYFTGRFADWEYYNMDLAIGASMDLCKTI